MGRFPRVKLLEVFYGAKGVCKDMERRCLSKGYMGGNKEG